MDKIPGIGANLVKTVTNLIDSKEEKSEDNALSTVLGSLKLYDDNSPLSTLSSKYRSTETLYDIVIRINNISDLRTQGWEILVGKHAKNILPIRMILDRNASTNSLSEKKQGVIATALGAYNRGKSFLLKKLCKIELPNGNLISTEGISITAGRENYTNLVFLDTAGTDTPVKNEEIEFKRATEALLREVVLHLSTFIIIVVNRLRATDQIYIKEILKYCRNTPNKKSVIIVHNFVDIETIEDLDKIIEIEVKKIFGAKLETLQLVVNRTAKSINYFTSYQSGIDVRHYILAKSRSNAADHWNKQTLDGIMNLLQNSENKQSLDIINDMIHFINTKLPQLFKQDNHYQNSSTSQNIQIVHSDRQHREDLLKDPLSLELAEKLVYDDTGYFIRNESGQWQPRYNLYDDKDNYYLIVETAGFRKGELKTSRSDKSINIEGTRLDLTKGMINPTTRQSDIPAGSPKLNIPFKKDINSDGVEIERDEGLLRFTIPKKKTNQIDEAV
ncbi:unnamed protein product [Adineta steineri]|uniref:SHSP domain-containing protein n=3 Tax=Adineta steineri TaxID=433720 RepID=A0A818HL44_9BILA|nr:unnamed protein product [Adineta steineri]CAF1229538.1 unnamed protein product [Adineta steineri]CAF3505190.1 unnamed protein product [Adineta steineri]